MADFYDESVRPWLPVSLGGYKRMEVDEEDEGEADADAQHVKAD